MTATPASGRSAQHLPALDGVRGIAIILVVLGHAGLNSADKVGMPVFFALSGYLITTIVARERDSGRIDLRAFYGRRIRRLGPALGVLLVIVAILGLAPATSILGAIAYVKNLQVAFFPGSDDVLKHTWSLAVEEQFYLLWPIAFGLIGRRRWLVLVLSALALLSMADRAGLWFSAGWERAYYGSDARADALLVGCAFALTNWRPPRVFVAASITALAIGTLLPNYEEFWVVGGLAISAVASGAVVAAPPAWLGWRPLAWMGMISYGVYLWHWPLMVLSGRPEGLAAAPVVVLSVAAGAASYLLVERRFRSRRRPMPVGIDGILAVSPIPVPGTSRAGQELDALPSAPVGSS